VAVFDILMVLALGTLAGTCIGLAIGCVAQRQNPLWQLMTQNEKMINFTLVLFFSILCTAGLAWYSLT
jgi:hypothetical protein